MESNLCTRVDEYPLIDRQSGRLSKEFMDLMKKNMDEEWLPYYDNNTGYR